LGFDDCSAQDRHFEEVGSFDETCCRHWLAEQIRAGEKHPGQEVVVEVVEAGVAGVLADLGSSVSHVDGCEYCTGCSARAEMRKETTSAKMACLSDFEISERADFAPVGQSPSD